MKFRQLGYWFTTCILAFAFALGGLFDVTLAEPAVAGLRALGYPVYFATLLGVWKLLGAVAVLWPGYPRLKEWAYAGIVFDLTGAAYSHASAGDSADKFVAPLVLLGIAVASWALRPDSRKLTRLGARKSEPETVTAAETGQHIAA